jgi:hypothetical protein
MRSMVLKIVLALVMASGLAYANGVERYAIDYQSFDKEVSEDTKSALEFYLMEQCQPGLMASEKVSVKSLFVAADHVDNGIIDYTYKFEIVLKGAQESAQEIVTVTLFEAQIHNVKSALERYSLVDLSPKAVCQ